MSIRNCGKKRYKVLVLFFFFSSRRRHTRYWRDWSSDVCSSDLRDLRWGRVDETFGEDPFLIGELGSAMIRGYQGGGLDDPTRSEERRVGKECRSRWSPYH